MTAVPAEVWESSEITKVDLSRNSIEVLPDELSSCSSLEVNISLFCFSKAKAKVCLDDIEVAMGT